MKLLLIALLAIGTTWDVRAGNPLAENNPYVKLASPDEQEARIEALRAAYEAMEAELLSAQGKIIVIKEQRGLIVVAFLNDPSQAIHDGQAWVLYDPKKKTVVGIEAEG
ncbi:MAG: hypothetical protein R3F22_02765 [Lysobacteraceae bacterium]